VRFDCERNQPVLNPRIACSDPSGRLRGGATGEVVSKERLMRSVWPDAFVGDDVLTRCISELRRVFGDDAKEPRFIQTIPKSGYRLIAPVSRGAARKLLLPDNPYTSRQWPPATTTSPRR